MSAACPDYTEIKALAAELKRPASTLYALSDACDPFYLTPGRRAAAEWFAEVWRVLDARDGVHVRRLHYSFVSLPEDQRPPKLNGQPYENTERDWNILTSASVDARALGLVDVAAFTDRRAGEPIHNADDEDDADSGAIAVNGADGAALERPSAESGFCFQYTPQACAFPELPTVEVIEPQLAELFAIEAWSEKSTQNDTLVPLARQYGFTLVTGVGELSLTHCHWLIERALAHGKPVRILYISDFDPAGNRMPVSVARKIEHLIRRDGLDLDIKLEPLVLTRAQVEDYRLPRIPIKDSDLGKRHFEQHFGEGATELDALEALHPGELRQLIVAAIARYREPTKDARQENEAIAAVVSAQAEDERQAVLAEFDSELAELRRAHEAMQQSIWPHQQALAAIAAEAARQSREHLEAINGAVAAFYDRAEELWHEIAEALTDRLPTAEEIDSVSADEDDDDPLFDSARGYVEQHDRYKEHLGKPTTRRARNGKGGAP